MQQPRIFERIEESHVAELWGQEPVCIGHRLHHSPLFQRDMLSKLIEIYPRERYGIIHMGELGSKQQYWREGDLNGLSGEHVLEAISQGRLWLNLRNVEEVDHHFKALLGDIFEELEEYIPGFVSYKHSCGILIASPRAQVYYHSDSVGQLLFQISGSKKIYLYPAKKPFLTAEGLQQIAVSGLELGIPYSEWYDDYARVFEFGPGQMLHWPHYAPHRTENHDHLNISMTVEFITDDIRRAQVANFADGVLRYRFGCEPKGGASRGPAFWVKQAVSTMWRRSSWFKEQRAIPKRIQFVLDDTCPGWVRDLPTSDLRSSVSQTCLRAPEGLQ